MKYTILTPLVRMTPAHGIQSFTVGDVIEIEDAGEAKRMQAAGFIVPLAVKAKAEKTEQIEQAVPDFSAVEKSARGKKGKGKS